MLLTTVTNLLDSGAGSLRDAIATTPSGGTVDFQPGLTGTITLTSGEIVITNTLNIAGPGSGSFAISGGNTSRIFDFTQSTSNVTITGLTLENGYTSGPVGTSTGTTAGWGGAIENYGTLTISNCTITNSFANFGGGAIDDWGPLKISNSLFTNNTTTPSLGGGGGAIYSSRGTLNIVGSTFAGNSGQQGGAIINNSGNIVVDTSIFTSNIGGVGGGVFNVFGTGTITNSTFTGNDSNISAGFAGGGVANSGGATLTISGSTFNGNSAGTGSGGAIYNQDSTLTLTNSTLIGNSATSGGAIDNQYSVAATTMTVNNSTITGNTATNGGGIYDVAGGAPAVTATLNTFDTIVAGNIGKSASPDVYGTIASLGHNLIGIGTGGGGYATTDLVGSTAAPINPALGTLQNNGGPTLTMALLPGSPAINAGDNTNAPQFDQRGTGFARIVGNAIDIGAFEVQNPTSQSAPTVSVNAINIIYGTPLANSQLSGTATALVNGLSVTVPGTLTFTSASAVGTVLGAGNGQTEQVTFTPTDAISYSSVQTSVTINVQPATPQIQWSNPASITYGTALTSTQLNAIASVPGTLVYTPAAGTVLTVGTQTLSVSFKPTDTLDYTAASASVQLQVNQATPVFTNLSSPTISAGTALTTLSGQLGAGTVYPAGDSVTVTVNGSSLKATVAANGSFSVPVSTASLAVGSYTITYAFAGDANFFATNATSTLTVTAKATIAATGVSVSAIAGAPVTATVAAFTNIDPTRAASTYLTAVTWGDGTSTAGIVSGTGTSLTVSGTHTYAAPGTYTVQVLIVDIYGKVSPGITSSTATVKSQAGSAGEIRGSDFWNSSTGKALILSFNGGAKHTELANWLSSHFANLYGANAGTNNLTGKTNADVAMLFHSLGKGLAQDVLATALDVYASTTSLGGTQGATAKFLVSATGLGALSVNVDNYGAAVGTPNDTKVNIYQLLSGVNNLAKNGKLYNGNLQLQKSAMLLFSEFVA